MERLPPTNIRLTTEEETKVAATQQLLCEKLGGMRVTKSHAIHVLIAKGYEAIKAEMGGKKAVAP